MQEEGLRIDIRRNKICDMLSRDGKVRVADLSRTLNVSEVTIRNDLMELEKSGHLERISGGAVQNTRNYYNINFISRKKKNASYKQAIASRVSDMINDGETLMINSGTTTFFIATEIKKHKNLNIVTNSLSVAVELGSHPTFRVILLGGDINSQYSFTHGNDCISQLSNYKADKCILSVDGVCPQAGLTTYHAEEAKINRTMMNRSRETIITADYSKAGHESFSRISDLSVAKYWVTNKYTDSDLVRVAREKGMEVVLADT